MTSIIKNLCQDLELATLHIKKETFFKEGHVVSYGTFLSDILKFYYIYI